MRTINFKKILFIVSWVALGFISCWATAESLILLLPSWPGIACYIVTIAFFIIASFGLKLITDSLDRNKFVEKRSLKLFGGIAIMLFFWLFCSMPTNTHAFFYRNVASDTIDKDIVQTQGYLMQLQNDQTTQDSIKNEIAKLRSQVEAKLVDLEMELKNPNNPGNGPKTKSILRELATLVGVDQIIPLSGLGSTEPERLQLVDSYRSKVYSLRDAKEKSLVELMTPSNTNYKQKAEKEYQSLETLKEKINTKKIDIYNTNDIEVVCGELNTAYNIIKTNKAHIKFQSKEDEILYTSNNIVTQVQQLKSVIDVWKDYLKGVYKGRGFIFWVMISVLVDIASFIFFDLAIKDND